MTDPPADDSGFRLLKANRLRLLSDELGAIEPSAEGPTTGPRAGLGLYLGDTRLACRLELRIGGRPLIQTTAAAHAGGPTASDSIPLGVAGRPGIRLVRGRRLGSSLAERLSVTELSRSSRPMVIRLTIGFDALDIFEVRGFRRRRRGELLPSQVTDRGARFAYLGLDRRLRTLAVEVEPRPATVRGSLRRRGREQVAVFSWRSTPDEPASLPSWRLTPGESDVVDRADALARAASRVRRRGRPPPARGRVEASLDQRATGIEVDDLATQRVLDRALDDLELLAEDGPGPDEWFVAAGLPWYAALFGRDSLLTAYESIAFRPGVAVEALAVLAAHQAGHARSSSDPEAGKILHELRTGEMARLGEVPFGPSFGSVDATPLWLGLLAEADDWLGDDQLLDGLWPHALRALAWIDGRVGPDSAGFLGYAGRPGALANEGWKDSPDAVRDRFGAVVPPPIALAEVQGYVYDAWIRMAGLARRRGEDELAAVLAARAAGLRARFEPAFWVTDRGILAMALGGQDHVADAVASNAGQVLASGILEPAAAALVAARILAPDMDSGWGIRTLAASEPAFDPGGYHTGSVWPHDTALIVGGLRGAGLDDAAVGVADRLLEAAGALPQARLPELFRGEQRRPGDRRPQPAAGACAIQAWSSAAPLHLVRTLLGLRPAARSGRLFLDRPRLPSALDRIQLRGLTVGQDRLDLDVRRTRSGGVSARAGAASTISVVITDG
jgi:glycogen debranching enzyme